MLILSLSQQKFNLLREESEGYSKVVAELDSSFDVNSVDLVIEHLQSLIGKAKSSFVHKLGYFDLDPNRVFDIILDIFENYLEKSEAYLKLIRSFSIPYLPHLLGFKFAHYAVCVFL